MSSLAFRISSASSARWRPDPIVIAAPSSPITSRGPSSRKSNGQATVRLLVHPPQRLPPRVRSITGTGEHPAMGFDWASAAIGAAAVAGFVLAVVALWRQRP